MAGIALYSTIASYYLPLALGAIVVLALIDRQRESFSHSLLSLSLAMAAGSLSMHVQHYQLMQRASLLPTTRCDLRARVIDYIHTPTKTFPFRFTLTVESIQRHTKKRAQAVWEDIPISIHLFCRKETHLKPGMYVQISGITLTRITNQELTFYAMKEGIACSAFVSNVHYTIIEDASENWWYAKHTLAKRIQKQLSPDCFWLFASIFLGNKTQSSEAQTQTKIFFNRWGIAHHLARSGLHLVIIILVWHIVARILPFHFLLKQLLFIGLSLLYLHLSWPSIPFYRALWTFLLHRTCLLMRIRPHLIHIIALVCLLCLLKNPVQLFFLDFQLSFALTFALIILGHIETTQIYKKKEILAS